MKMNKEIKILDESTIVELPKNFKKSIYSAVYEKTLKLIQEIVRESAKKENEENNNGLATLKKEEIDNTITFIGGRGTGKTTVMFSLLNYLNNYHYINRSDDRVFSNLEQEKDIVFYCLDYIDGGLLEDKENIIQILIANMYKRFMKIAENRIHDDWREYDIRELQEAFINVEYSIKQIKKDWDVNESSIESLKNLSSSLGLKKELAGLIKKYLRMMSDKSPVYSECSKRRILVLAIDDLDLNGKNGFDILENIHRYLMIPNVIVMISADYPRLMDLCKKHFEMAYYNQGHLNRFSQYEEEEVEEVSRDYLNKVLPVHKRVYLKEFSYDSKYFVKTNDLELGLKAYTFKLMYRKMRIIFDALGEKRHFYEFKNIRELQHFSKFLTRLRDLNLDGGLESCNINELEEIEAIIEWNYEDLLSDYNQRFLNHILHNSLRTFMERVIKSNLAKGANELYDMMKKAVIDNLCENNRMRRNTDLDKSGWSYHNKLTENTLYLDLLEEQQYSYGAFLQIMYIYGRIEYKNFVHCILCYYTIKLNYLKYILMIKRTLRKEGISENQKDIKSREREIENEKDIKNIERQIIHFLGGTIAGDWTQKMLPRVASPSIKSKYNQILQIGNFIIHTNNCEKLQLKFNLLLNSKFSEELLNSKIVPWIKKIECLLMLFTTNSHDSIKLNLK